MMRREDYSDAYNGSVLTDNADQILDLKTVCKVITNNQLIYWGVEKTTCVPWYVVAAIHYRESSSNFKCHLHNGDPLNARTVHVPEGRPVEGSPPFTWTQSAIDALSGRKLPFVWEIPDALEFCERYNGLGYQLRGSVSPYVWSFTNKYSGGLFVADGTIDTAKHDARPGVAAIFKTLQKSGVTFEPQTTGKPPNTVLH